MPKDRSENIDRYKVRGGQFNDYDAAQNDGAMAQQEQERFDFEQTREGLRGASEPNALQNLAERIREVEKSAHEKVERRRAKQHAGGAELKGAAKSAAKKAANKSEKQSAKKAVKKTTKKTAASKPAQGRAAGKKAASKSAKKGAAKSAGKAAARGSNKAASKKGSGSGK